MNLREYLVQIVNAAFYLSQKVMEGRPLPKGLTVGVYEWDYDGWLLREGVEVPNLPIKVEPCVLCGAEGEWVIVTKKDSYPLCWGCYRQITREVWKRWLMQVFNGGDWS